MSLDAYARHFFEILREQKGDATGKSLYSDEARHALHQVGLPFFEDLPDDFGTLLDVGCGAGFDAAYFAGRGKTVTAITANPTPAQEEYALAHGFAIRHMDMNALNFADGTFDAILCKHVLEHSVSPLASLFELRRVLKPGGYLFLVLPPHHPTLVESGHFTQGWTIGQMIYCLCVTGFDVKSGAFRARSEHIEAVVRPAPSVPEARGLYELKPLMPEAVQDLMRTELHGAFPAAAFTQISWPFAGKERRTLSSKEVKNGGLSLRHLLRMLRGTQGEGR